MLETATLEAPTIYRNTSPTEREAFKLGKSSHEPHPRVGVQQKVLHGLGLAVRAGLKKGYQVAFMQIGARHVSRQNVQPGAQGSAEGGGMDRA